MRSLLTWGLGLASMYPQLGSARPIRSPIEAVAALRGTDRAAAVKSVDAACRGRTGRQLRDHKSVLAEALRWAKAKDVEKRKASLDLHRCFSETVFVEKLLVPRLDDVSPEVVAYAAEIGGRLESPVVVPLLLDRLDARAEACRTPGLDAAALDVCVWLTYAPGTGLARADAALRARAAAAAAAMAHGAPYPKIREVAVETLAAAGLEVHAKTIEQLIAKERKGAFEPANDGALLRRFAKRAKTLKTKGE